MTYHTQQHSAVVVCKLQLCAQDKLHIEQQHRGFGLVTDNHELNKNEYICAG